MIVVDVETGGLDPREHALLSIGAVDFWNADRRFYLECQAREGSTLNGQALAINGFTLEQVHDKDKPVERDAVAAFLAFARGDTILGGHNPAFDRDFLREAAGRASMYWSMGHRTVDLHSVAYARLVGAGFVVGKLHLDEILNRVGMPSEPRPHNALTGALMETEAMHRLIFVKNVVQEYAKYPLPGWLTRQP
jgi:DNA polymerase III epsilon subunit-like protein